MFVDRVNGTVTGVYARSQYDGQEQIADDSPELVAFQTPALDGTDASRALVTRRAADLAASPDLADQIEGLKLRLQLLGG